MTSLDQITETLVDLRQQFVMVVSALHFDYPVR